MPCLTLLRSLCYGFTILAAMDKTRTSQPHQAVVVDGVTLRLAQPLESSQEWIGAREILTQLLACWLVIDDKDLPLSPRITGPPGIGKTTLAMSGARERKQNLYVFQCTADTRPEDLLVTPVLAESGTIAYHASPLDRKSTRLNSSHGYISYA